MKQEERDAIRRACHMHDNAHERWSRIDTLRWDGIDDE